MKRVQVRMTAPGIAGRLWRPYSPAPAQAGGALKKSGNDLHQAGIDPIFRFGFAEGFRMKDLACNQFV